MQCWYGSMRGACKRAYRGLSLPSFLCSDVASLLFSGLVYNFSACIIIMDFTSFLMLDIK